MNYINEYANGLKVVTVEMPWVFSVAVGVLVRTGSANETAEENGISHFIEHTVFKGTQKRSAFEISDFADRIGGQINAYTSKMLTCYYMRSTKEHLEDSFELLSDIFFHSTFEKSEINKEKGVIVEEINMSEDSPEDLCFDLLAESYFGKGGLGQTILGSAANVRSFNGESVRKYMDKYYCADNVVIAVAGKVTKAEAQSLAEKYFVSEFSGRKSAEQAKTKPAVLQNLRKIKKIEQSHIGFSMPAVGITDPRKDALIIANTVLGGGMSSRLFQKIREEMGLAYSVYSGISCYADAGVCEVYAGVSTESRDQAAEAVISEIKRFKKDGITESEFLRGKEQIISSLIFGQESVSGQMQLYGRYALLVGGLFDFENRLSEIKAITKKETDELVAEFFDMEKSSSATVGPKRTPIKIIG